jgi:hypothetical protein
MRLTLFQAEGAEKVRGSFEEVNVMARNYIRWLLRPVTHCKEGCCRVSSDVPK